MPLDATVKITWTEEVTYRKTVPVRELVEAALGEALDSAPPQAREALVTADGLVNLDELRNADAGGLDEWMAEQPDGFHSVDERAVTELKPSH